MKEIRTKYEITEFRENDSNFFSKCKDIVKNTDGSYCFEQSAWIDNKHLCSYHSIEELFNPEREYNRNCAICSHASFSGHGLLMDKYNCRIASELNRKQQSTIDFCKQNNIDPDNLSVSTNFIVKCEAYDEICELNVIKNMKEMIDFMYKTFNMLDGWDGVCGYYGFEIPYDWDNNKAECTIYEYYQNGGTFDKAPKEEEFPVVIYFDYNCEKLDGLKWISLKGKEL